MNNYNYNYKSVQIKIIYTEWSTYIFLICTYFSYVHLLHVEIIRNRCLLASKFTADEDSLDAYSQDYVPPISPTAYPIQYDHVPVGA